jgi:riboflavin synthase
MFTGIVEQMGKVSRLTRRAAGARLEVHAPAIVGELKIGDSVSVNGACVTVTEKDHEAFACDLVVETVARTNLGILQPDEEVNLELPMRVSDRLGGHLVQGHVDAVGSVRSRRRVGTQEILEVTIPFELTRYLAPQGSVALDGVSLTVVAVDKERFRVALIPHTVGSTTLGHKGQGAPVNVEVDVLSKYVERHMAARAARPTFPPPVEEQPAARQDGSSAAKPVARPTSPARAAAAKPAAKKPAAAKPAAKKPAAAKPAAKKPKAASRKTTKTSAKRPARSAKSTRRR